MQMVSCLMFVQGPENLTQQTSQLLSVEVYKKAGMHGVGQCKKGKEGFFCPESGKPVLQDGSRNARKHGEVVGAKYFPLTIRLRQ